MTIDIDLQKIVDRVEKLTDEEVARAVLSISTASSGKAEDRKKAEKELIRATREQLEESGQLEAVLREAGITTPVSTTRRKKNAVRLNWDMIEQLKKESENADQD